MKRICDYDIVWNPSAKETAEDAKKLIKMGWQPYGSLQMSNHKNDYDETESWYAQAMVKEEDDVLMSNDTADKINKLLETGRDRNLVMDEKLGLIRLLSSPENKSSPEHIYVACCPWHEEKTPSFMINRNEDSFRCFGCGVSGQIIFNE